MASPSRDALPVLEEWHVSEQRKRPKLCGVEGCASRLVTSRQVQSRLCATHCKLAVLRGGMPQRWCSYCHQFHALKAFSGSQRCASASHW